MTRILSTMISLLLLGRPSWIVAQDDLTPVEPFQIFDNLYYVGLEAVSAYLVTTSDGLILIDALYPESAEHIPRALVQLGFDPQDVRYVIVTHAHIDHAGGAAAIQALTGARVGMAEADWDFYSRGGSRRALDFPMLHTLGFFLL